MRNALKLCGAAAVVGIAAQQATAAVVITEIHYNPNGSEGANQEWIEIYNTGPAAVDLSGWDWGDSQDGTFTDDFPAGTTLAAGGAAVLCPQSPATFQGIWGAGIQVIQTSPGISLANGATSTNETVVIRDAGNTIIDAVNYENALNGWPDDNNQSTIYLQPDAIDVIANDVGSNWGLAAVGVDGGFQALTINPEIANATLQDLGSPGTVALVPEPASMSLLGLGGLTLLARRRRMANGNA